MKMLKVHVLKLEEPDVKELELEKARASKAGGVRGRQNRDT